MKISPVSEKRIREICSNRKEMKTPLMMILSDIQKEFGYIPFEVQQIVSEETGIPVAEIYGVVTFYSFFSLKPKGKYVIGVCLGTACYVKGSQQIIERFQEILNIGVGETTKDNLFSIDALRCLGTCGVAPAVKINKKVYQKVKVSNVAEIIAYYRNLEEVK